MFKQLEYSEILLKNLLRKFSRCAHDEGSNCNDFFPAQPSDKVSDAQQMVIIIVNTFKNTFSIQQSVVLQFYCFTASYLRQR